MNTPPLKDVGEGVGVFAAVAYALSLMFSKRHKAVREVGDEIEVETGRLIDLLKEQRDSLEIKVDTLTDRVDNLARVIEVYACPNAPTCAKRPRQRLVLVQEMLDS